MTNWHQRFLQLAQTVSTWSKDPSSQVGSVIVRPDKTVVSLGFNGLPRGVKDSDENLTNRERKYEMVIHAEINSILTARGETTGNTLYVWPFPPCSRCAAQIIQSGIVRVVWPYREVPERWMDNFLLAMSMMKEAGVDLMAPPPEAP